MLPYSWDTEAALFQYWPLGGRRTYMLAFAMRVMTGQKMENTMLDSNMYIVALLE